MHDELLRAPRHAARRTGRASPSRSPRLGPQELARRWEQARRLLRENGVTYNVYGDPRGTDRPWELDPLPLLLAAGRVAGARGRAGAARAAPEPRSWPTSTARSACCATASCRPSCCGPIPASCARATASRCPLGVLAAPPRRRPGARARRPLVGARRPHAGAVGRGLRAREPHRPVARAARALPRVPRAAAGGLLPRAARDAARAGAAPSREPAHRRCSRPGAYNETYFEHAYLARYLGYTLVEGADLTVRDQAVFLKTLGGLEPVDVILRRLDDDFCDPLALRTESSLGVAGPACRRCAPAPSRWRTRSAAGWSRRPRCCPFLPGLCRAPARRGPRHPVGRDVVVRPAARARVRDRRTSTSW